MIFSKATTYLLIFLAIFHSSFVVGLDGQSIPKLFSRLLLKYGDDATEITKRLDEAAKELGTPKENLYKWADTNGWLRVGDLTKEKIKFGYTNGEAGSFFLKSKKFWSKETHSLDGLEGIADNRLWLHPNSKEAVQDAYELIRTGKGWAKLRASMTKCGLNSNERNFCETIFKDLAQKGKIQGITKEEASKMFVLRNRGNQGFDFFVPSTSPNGDPIIRLIEVGTGKKPSVRGGLVQMSKSHVRKVLKDHLKNPDHRIRLRDNGLPLRASFDKKIDDLELDEFFTREIYANDIAEELATQNGILTRLLDDAV